MSKSLHSPTARLLQSSRLFSLPRPLPQPALESASASGSYRASDTATLPYPTHQAIATPASSHFRGDWGLKRPIPRKTTARSTTPVIRVRAQDNTQHITDFDSAADHVLTASKWQQMGVPLLHKEVRSLYAGERQAGQSVYDDHLDITDPEAARRNALQMKTTAATAGRRQGAPAGVESADQRWKFEGPWIPGMQEAEFDDYIHGKLTKRKAEFRQFLTKRILEKRIHDEERVNRDRGLARAMTTSRVEELRKEVEENYDSEEKKMRDDHAVQNLGSELTAAICDFLDLPGIRGARRNYAKSQLLQAQINSLTADQGPPSTHPGAGLSHIRTNAFMENHPYWGPQAHRSPVKARVLRPRNSILYTEYQAKLGVGGVVTSDPIGSSNHPSSRSQIPEYTEDQLQEHYLDNDRMTSAIDENLPGGNKVWVQPEYATISEAGHIHLHISRGDKEAIAVKRDQVEQIHKARSQSYGVPTGPGYVSSAIPGQEPNYGYSLPGLRQERQRPVDTGVRGFDEELGRSPRQGQMERAEAARSIRELMHGAGARGGSFGRR